MEPIAKKSKATYRESWEHQFGICLVGEKEVICVLCGVSFSCWKTSNFARHLDQFHPKFNKEFPLNSQQRYREIAAYQAIYTDKISDVSIITDSLAAIQISFDVAYIIGKSKKPFEDGELHKKTINAAFQRVFGSKYSEFIDSIPLSRRTVTRRIDIISGDLHQQLHKDIELCNFFSIQLDESTDVGDTAQLLIFIRMVFSDFSIREELLSMISLHGRTTGENIYNLIIDHFREISLPVQKLIAVTADGASNITGRFRGLYAHFQKENTLKHVNFLHCIIHQQALCMKSLSIPEIENTVVKIVNSIKARATQHRLFKTFAEEINPDFRDLKFYTEVRWLSKGIMLERFYENIEIIYKFCAENGENHEKLRDFDFISKLAFLVDLTNIINMFNLELQGNNLKFWENIEIINKLKNFLTSAATFFNRNLIHARFLRLTTLLKECQGEVSNQQLSVFLQYINKLLNAFDDRFKDFESMTKISDFLMAPFNPNEDVITLIEAIKSFDIYSDKYLPNIMADIDSIRENKRLRAILCAGGDIWDIIKQENLYPGLTVLYQKLTSCFGSTYLCESTFSNMKLIKSLKRNSLVDSNLENALRISLSVYTADTEKLAASMYERNGSESVKK